MQKQDSQMQLHHQIPDFKSLLDYLNEVGLYNIDELKQLVEDYHPSIEINVGFQVLILAGIIKQTTLEGNLTKAMNAFKQAELLISKNEGEIHPDYIAFLYYEYNQVYSYFDDKSRFEKCLKKAIQHAESKTLISLIEYKMALLTEGEDKIQNLITQIEKLKKTKKHATYVIGLYRIGITYAELEDYDNARKYYDVAKEKADEYGVEVIGHQIENAIGYLYIRNNQLDKGVDYLTDHIGNVKSYYTKVLMTENIAYAYYLKKDYTTSAEKFLDAYNMAKINNVISQLPEECTFLGHCYSKLNKPQEALAYYKLGYDHALEQINEGFSYSGVRLNAMDAYVKYLETVAYHKFEKDPIADPFQFALGKTWKEILNLFQYNFIMIHLRQTNVKDKFFKQINMKPSTYFSAKSRLKKAEFNIPNIKDTSKEYDENKEYSLQLYIKKNLIELSWKEANKRFEKDMFRFLYQQYAFQNRKMESILKISYPNVLLKIKNIGGSDLNIQRNYASKKLRIGIIC